jgi:23S rRNA (guanosine2251-2'-O)-methyltransferase
MTYITGFHAMEELLRAGKARGCTLLVAAPGPRVKRIVELAGKSGVDVRKVQSTELDSVAPDHRGAALVLKEAPKASELDLTDWLASSLPEKAIVIILDHIEDPHNLGPSCVPPMCSVWIWSSCPNGGRQRKPIR